MGDIVKNDEIRSRNELKQLKHSKTEKEKEMYSGITFTYEKKYAIDKIIRKRLKEDGYCRSYSHTSESLPNSKSRFTNESNYVIRLIGSLHNTASKISYAEWLDRKKAESLYWKILIDTERQEQTQLEEEKKKEEIKLIEHKY